MNGQRLVDRYQTVLRDFSLALAFTVTLALAFDLGFGGWRSRTLSWFCRDRDLNVGELGDVLRYGITRAYQSFL